MARSQSKESETIREERDSMRQRVNELERILARVDHAAMLSKLPQPMLEYGANLPNKVLALAAIGLATSELRSELGFSLEQQIKWQREHPQFAAALSRAKDLAHAYWQRLAREALESKDWKFPYSQAQRFVSSMLQEDGGQLDTGDASTLIHIDLAECPKCGYLTGDDE